MNHIHERSRRGTVDRGVPQRLRILLAASSPSPPSAMSTCGGCGTGGILDIASAWALSSTNPIVSSSAELTTTESVR
jgi:hypothetical protein